jgi:Flp pilus assembly protein TadD
MKPVLTCVIVAAALLVAAGPPSVEERLARHRNLGKAFYENPTTQTEAVAEFKAALDLAPNSNREKLNYALALLRAGQADKAVPLLQEVQKRDPQIPHTWFNLGIYYKKAGETEQAVAQFERLIALAPNEPIAHYQLGTLYRLQDRTADARAQFERAAALDPQLAAAIRRQFVKGKLATPVSG